MRPVSARFLLSGILAASAVPSGSGQTGAFDPFGIRKIYADAPAPANNWYFDGDPRDARLMEQPVVPVGNGWYRPVDPAEMRVEVLSDPAANEASIPTFDVPRVLKRGYLFKAPNSPDGKGDFLNIEQTWRFRVLKAGSGTRNGPAHVELVPGGFRQDSSAVRVGADRAVPRGCESMSYHFNIYPLTGRVKFEKDSDHAGGYTAEGSDPQISRAVAPFADGREVVEKAVLYRTSAGMKLELFVDMTGQGRQFEKVMEYEDSGRWGPTQAGNSECHCGEFVVLNMARVAIGYRCDNLAGFEFRDMSIRSIDPGRRLWRPAAQ